VTCYQREVKQLAQQIFFFVGGDLHADRGNLSKQFMSADRFS
jgi:hypothetical protein